MLKLNGVKIDVTMFPDNTSQVWQVPEVAFEGKKFNIDWEFSHEGELFHLLQLVQLIKHGRVPRPIHLHMPYLPYGRQDKDLSNDATFALKPFCNLLDSLNITSITTYDAHSLVAEKWLSNFISIHPSLEIDKALQAVDATSVAFPDAGACDRYACTGELDIYGNIVRTWVINHTPL